MQVIAHQWLTGEPRLPPSDVSHRSRAKHPLRPTSMVNPGPNWRLLLALTFWLAAPLSAQSRGEVRAQARVLPAQQSREALEAGWHTIADGLATGSSALATIRVGQAPVVAGMLAVGVRPRRPELLRIDFLRN